MKPQKLMPFLLYCFSFFCCSPVSALRSPNNLKNIEGVLYLNDGHAVSGKLAFNNEVLISKWIKVYTDENKKALKFHLLEVKGYQVGADYYELKQIKNTLAVGKNFYFMKRLTAPGSRIHLYEHLEKKIQHKPAPSTTYVQKYYMQFPGEYNHAVWSLDSERLAPHFHLKMSEVVADCQPLAQKIARKEDGFFYTHLNATPSKRISVMFNIIQQYNQCR